MKKVLLLMFALSVSCFGQLNKMLKTDAEIAGLKGKVKDVSLYRWDSDDYNEKGFLIITDRSAGCPNTLTYGDFNFENRTRQIKREVKDYTGSGTCGRFFKEEIVYFKLPAKELTTSTGKKILDFPHFITYEVSYKTSADSEYSNRGYIADSKTKFIEENAKVGKMFAWRTKYFFDENSRLVEEIHINYNLTFRLTKYFYNEKDTFPVSSEKFLDNILFEKKLYQYEKFDKEGNWIKRIATDGTNKNSRQPQSFTEERTITYY